MRALYVCVHVAEFPAQALMRLRHDLAHSAVAVLGGEAPLEQVCSANARAVGLGVCDAMSRTELESFPSLKLLKRSLAEERSAQAVVMEAVNLFTPRVEVQPTRGAGWAVVLDMTGSGRIFGNAEQMVGRIAQAMKDLNFSVRIAASSNFLAAACLAPSALRTPLVIADGEETQHLAGLPLSALGLTAAQGEVFELWGLRTLGELAALPEVDLIVRLGQHGKRLRLLARGEHPHHMRPEEAVFALEEFLNLDVSVELLESLLFVLSPMFDQLIRRAQHHAYALASVTVRLGLEQGQVHERTIKPALPVADRELLLKLFHLDLQAHPPVAGVVTVFVSAEPGERGKVQLGLWSPQLPEPTRLDVTLARIAALVGEEQVGCAVLPDTHSPGSFQMKRFVVPTSPGKSGFQINNSVALRRCRPPVVIAVRYESGQLVAFHLAGTLYMVDRAYGPWRRSGDWWSAKVWSTEEWDVQATAQGGGLLCVVSHDLLHGQWKMEAVYD